MRAVRMGVRSACSCATIGPIADGSSPARLALSAATALVFGTSRFASSQGSPGVPVTHSTQGPPLSSYSSTSCVFGYSTYFQRQPPLAATAQPTLAYGDAAVVRTAYQIGAPIPVGCSSKTFVRPMPGPSNRVAAKLCPSGEACPLGYGPSVHPTSAQIVGATSMFWIGSSIVRGLSPRAPGHQMKNGIWVSYGEFLPTNRCSP